MAYIQVRASQALISQTALFVRRQIDQRLENMGLRPFNTGTPARKHKITDRAARKAKARAYALERVTNGVDFEVARHGWQIKQAAELAARDGLAAIDFGEAEVRVPGFTERPLEVTPRARDASRHVHPVRRGRQCRAAVGEGRGSCHPRGSGRLAQAYLRRHGV